MKRRGRPPLAPDRRCSARFVVRVPAPLGEQIRSLARYQGISVQALTRRWWQRAVEKYAENMVPQKSRLH